MREPRHPPSRRSRGARERGERNRGEGEGEEGEGVEVIFPPLALERVVGDAVDETQEGEPAANAVRLGQPSREAEEPDGEQTAPDLPAEHVPAEAFPHPDAAHATVEWQDVPDENGRERPGATAPREPAQHQTTSARTARARQAPSAITTAQPIQNSTACGLTITLAPAARPPHSAGPRTPRLSHTRAAPHAASTRKRARR